MLFSMIPATTVYHLCKLGVRLTLLGAMEATNLWGPLRPEDRERNIKNERVARAV